jgi:glycosyltransferase involved in cell wall biosynthesis
MNVLILWASLADYTIACFKELASKGGVTITLVYQPSKNIAPFEGLDLSFCEVAHEDKAGKWNKISSKLLPQKVDIIIMASWNFKHYMALAKMFKSKGIPVISAFDNQWSGGIRQQAARLIAPWFLKPVITNFLVPGDRQAQFARKLGYKQPLQGFYCANNKNFDGFQSDLSVRKFIFVGRFVEQKGILQLIEAYKQYRLSVNKPWGLVMIGEGPLKHKCTNIEGVEVLPFAQPKRLPFFLKNASCFILPSNYENWGLVIHEAALAALPIICSSACGASTWMLRDCQNGFLIEPERESICNSMIKIHNKSPEELVKMAKLSQSLGLLWTTDKWAESIYQSLKNYIYPNKF